MTRRAIWALLTTLCACRTKKEHVIYNDQAIASMDTVPGSLLIGTTTEPFLGEGKRQLVIRGQAEEHLVFTVDATCGDAKLMDLNGKLIASVIAGNVAIWADHSAVRARIAVARERLIKVRPLASEPHLQCVNRALSVLARLEVVMQEAERVQR